MEILQFIFSIICLMASISIIIFLYYIFRANDLFFAKMKEYQNLSRKMFQPGSSSARKERRDQVSRAKRKRVEESNHDIVEDAEFREV